MYEGDIWMQSERVNRHKGIAKESSFALAMYRWVNKIIEFIDVVQEMDQIGIVDIDRKVESLKAFKAKIQGLLAKKSKKAPFTMFRILR